MDEKVLHVGFNLVKNELSPDTLSEEFLLWDNLQISQNGINTMMVTDYPIRLDEYIACFCISGFSRMLLGQQEVKQMKNCFVMIPAGMAFRILEVSEDYRFGAIIMNSGFFPIQHEFIQAYNLQTLLFLHPCQQLSEKDVEEMLGIYELMKNKIREKQHTYRREIVRNYLVIMFYNVCHLLLSCKQQFTSSGSRKENVFEQFMIEVEKYFRRERSVGFYADLLCLTPKYVSTLIHEVSGRLPSDWIQDRVIMEAQALLKTTNLTIQQISDQLSFPNQSHFGRYFKKQTGFSPSDYRNK